MKESDWKVFKIIKDRAIDDFCTNMLAELREIIDDEKYSAHERYLRNYKLVINRDKHMGLLFDGHSRLKAPLQLLGIRREGLADEELVSKLSEEFRDQTDPRKHNW